jgi:glycosyltransferase involved in cell wall biosynthesis
VVVVDQGSSDGALEVLREFESRGSIRLFSQTVRNRGLGRQLAFEKSTGDFVISNMDMDDTFEPRLNDLVARYHQRAEGLALRVVDGQRRGAVTIAPRALIQQIGGWKDLDFLEDRYIWGLACMMGKYRWSIFPIYRSITTSRAKRSVIERVGRLYGVMRDRARIDAPKRYVWYTVPILAPALVSASLRPSLKNPFFRHFWPDDPKYNLVMD